MHPLQLSKLRMKQKLDNWILLRATLRGRGRSVISGRANHQTSSRCPFRNSSQPSHFSGMKRGPLVQTPSLPFPPNLALSLSARRPPPPRTPSLRGLGTTSARLSPFPCPPTPPRLSPLSLLRPPQLSGAGALRFLSHPRLLCHGRAEVPATATLGGGSLRWVALLVAFSPSSPSATLISHCRGAVPYPALSRTLRSPRIWVAWR